MVSSKYCAGKSVVVPSQAAGVKIGVSARMKPRPLKKSRTALMISCLHAEDRLLPLSPDPQVPAIQQEIDAVLLRRDRVVVRLADDLVVLDVDLVAARRPLVRPGRAGDDDGGFLGEVIRRLERLVADRGFRHDRLDEAGAVPQNQEVDLAARAAVVQPPLDRDLLPVVRADVLDVDVHTYICTMTGSASHADRFAPTLTGSRRRSTTGDGCLVSS